MQTNSGELRALVWIEEVKKTYVGRLECPRFKNSPRRATVFMAQDGVLMKVPPLCEGPLFCSWCGDDLKGRP